MRKSIILLGFLFYVFDINSQISPVIPSSLAIANTYVADSKQFNAFNNPSNITNVQNLQIAVQYENRFAIPELSTKSAQVILPSKLISTGVSFSYFGYSKYHEMLAGIGFARNFADKFSMGAQINYFTNYFIASNSYRFVIFPQFGLNIHLTPNFNLGFSSFNPFQSNIRTDFVLKRLPSVYSLGSEYKFSKDLLWRTQIDNEVSSNYRFATGFEYTMLTNFAVKLGAYGSDFLVPCLGLSIATHKIQLHFNAELHPLLGLNTIAGLSYRFNNESKSFAHILNQ